jgi:hypothetical protein
MNPNFRTLSPGEVSWGTRTQWKKLDGCDMDDGAMKHVNALSIHVGVFVGAGSLWSTGGYNQLLSVISLTCLFLIGHPHSIFSKIEDGWRRSVEHAKVLIHRSGFSKKKNWIPMNSFIGPIFLQIASVQGSRPNTG